MWKWTRRLVLGGILGVAALAGFGTVFLGTGWTSYFTSSAKMMRTAVKDSIPIEFEIQRSRDLLEDLIPEMKANLRLVAAEEVEVANLEKELERQQMAMTLERGKIHNLRDALEGQTVLVRFGDREYRRSEVLEELARRFEHLKTAEMLFAGKQELLKNRQRSLDAAIQKLEKTRIARIELASQIEALEGQFRLIQAQSSGSEFRIDDSKLAQTNRLISNLKKRLEVAQRVLAREAQFVEMVPLEPVTEKDILKRVDTYLANDKRQTSESGESVSPGVPVVTGESF